MSLDEDKILVLARELFRADFPSGRLRHLHSPMGEYYVQRARAKLVSARKSIASVPPSPNNS